MRVILGFPRLHYNAAVSDDPAQSPEPALAGEELARHVEAAMLTSDRALSTNRLAESLDVPLQAVREAIDALNTIYETSGRSFRIEEVAGGWQVMTLPRFADTLARLHRSKALSRLSPAALETLAIIAYKQPIVRAQIEAIRGVACGEVLRSLLERNLIKIAGRAEELGRPMLYGTTRTFLEVFGLNDLKDLPKVEQLQAPLESENT